MEEEEEEDAHWPRVGLYSSLEREARKCGDFYRDEMKYTQTAGNCPEYETRRGRAQMTVKWDSVHGHRHQHGHQKY